MRRLAIYTSILLLAGCAQPVHHDIENSRTIAAPYDKVWQSVVEYFATNNIPVKSIAKDSGLINAERQSFDPTFADCSHGMIVTSVGTRAEFNVYVKPKGDSTRVTVNARFLMTTVLVGGSDRYESQCESTGKLETAILDAISK